MKSKSFFKIAIILLTPTYVAYSADLEQEKQPICYESNRIIPLHELKQLDAATLSNLQAIAQNNVISSNYDLVKLVPKTLWSFLEAAFIIGFIFAVRKTNPLSEPKIAEGMTQIACVWIAVNRMYDLVNILQGKAIDQTNLENLKTAYTSALATQ